MNCRKTRIIFLSIAALVVGSTRLSAGIPSSLEPKYSEAVLAYNSKQFDRSIRLLKELLRQNPNLPEFLELEALSFKASNQDTKAAETYTRLLKVKIAAPSQETAPYQFELGSLHFKAGDFDKAEPEFQSALDSGFNPGAAHFFLGMIAFRKGDWLAAETHLEKFRAFSVPDLRPVASLIWRRPIRSPGTAWAQFKLISMPGRRPTRASRIPARRPRRSPPRSPCWTPLIWDSLPWHRVDSSRMSDCFWATIPMCSPSRRVRPPVWPSKPVEGARPMGRAKRPAKRRRRRLFWQVSAI